MSHLVFLVPGMGKNGPGWSDGAKSLLKKLYDSYNTDNISSFEEMFELKELHYDNVFEKIRERWRNDLAPVIATMKAAGLSDDAAKTLGTLNDTLTTDQFFGTHVLDVLFYRFYETIKQSVRATMIKQITGELKTPRDKWSIISHSLGTSVIHDVLHAMYTQGRLGSSDGRPRLLATFANVSHVLESNIGAHDSLVRPAASGSDGYCERFLNVAHKFDPVAMVRPFHPPSGQWLPDDLARYQFVELEEVYDVNVHDYLHYLNDPLAHIPLLEWLGLPFVIPDKTLQDRIKKHKDGAPVSRKLTEYKQKQAELEARLKAMKQEPSSLVAMIKEWLGNLRASS